VLQYFFQDDPQLLGRKASDFPLKRCCEADGCLVQGRQPRHAVITYIRTDAYLPLLQAGARAWGTQVLGCDAPAAIGLTASLFSIALETV